MGTTTIPAGYRPPQPRAYLFIDGNYLRQEFATKTARWFGAPEVVPVDYQTLKTTMYAAQKMFYYECPTAPKPTDATGDLDARVAEQEGEFERIRAVHGGHVRLGTLIGAQRKKPQTQKEVDVLLAVEVMTHAMRRNAERFVLLAGDRDFRPLVDALVQMGVEVIVAGVPRSASRELRDAADFFRPITFVDMFNWCPAELRQRFPLPKVDKGSPNRSFERIRQGRAGAFHCELLVEGLTYRVTFDRQGDNGLRVTGEDRERVETFADLEYGPITWET